MPYFFLPSVYIALLTMQFSTSTHIRVPGHCKCSIIRALRLTPFASWKTDARLQTDFIRKQLSEGTEDDRVPIDDTAVAVGGDPAEEGQGAGDLNDVEDASEGDTDIGSEPISRDALEWYSYISRHYRGAIPDRMRELAWERWSKIGEARPNSVGEFAKRLSAGGKL